MKLKLFIGWHTYRMNYYRNKMRAKIDSTQFGHAYLVQIHQDYKTWFERFMESRHILKAQDLVLTP